MPRRAPLLLLLLLTRVILQLSMQPAAVRHCSSDVAIYLSRTYGCSRSATRRDAHTQSRISHQMFSETPVLRLQPCSLVATLVVSWQIIVIE